MPRLPGLRQAWSQRLVEAADAAETRHTLQVDDDAVTPSSAEPESTTAPTAHPTPQTDPPGWELALYALILLGVNVPGAGESTDDQLVMRLVFPEKELGLCGARISSGRQAAAECLGLLIQTLRHLAVSHVAELEQHKTLLTSWTLRDVSMPPDSLFEFLRLIVNRDPRYCPYAHDCPRRAARWEAYRPAIAAIMLDARLRCLLSTVKTSVERDLLRLTLPEGMDNWWELWASKGPLPDDVMDTFISDEVAEYDQAVARTFSVRLGRGGRSRRGSWTRSPCSATPRCPSSEGSSSSSSSAHSMDGGRACPYGGLEDMCSSPPAGMPRNNGGGHFEGLATTPAASPHAFKHLDDGEQSAALFGGLTVADSASPPAPQDG